MKSAKRGRPSRQPMAAPPTPRPLRDLAVKLLLTMLLAAAVYTLFTVFNHRFLNGFSDPEILLLEAVAITLIAYTVARAVTTASDAVMARRGLASHGHAVRLFINILIAVGLVLALFKLAGVSAESILLGSAFAGIVVGLAAQTVLSNVLAGLLLVLSDPFRPGDRVSFVSSTYPALPPSYPHELTYPSYTGTIADVGLIYTVLWLDSGTQAKIPNSVVIGSLLLKPRSDIADVHRIRMTFPLSVDVTAVEAALPEITEDFPKTGTLFPKPRLEVADISAASWDGVFILWVKGRDESTVRDSVLRRVLPRLEAATRPRDGTASVTP